jgi:dihydrofolate synthase/folylpolyglutamate synthase
MQYVSGAPALLLDGAHNRASMERLLDALAAHFPKRPVAVVFGAAADKDVDGMLGVLARGWAWAAVVFTRTDHPRAAEPDDLAERYARLGADGAGAGGAADGAATAASAAEAVRCARDVAGDDGLVVVCGSLYLVGEVVEVLRIPDS